MTRRRALAGTTPFLVLLLLGAACGSSSPPPPPTGGGKTVDPATTGTISGRAVFTGAAPAVETLKMTTDKACVAAAGPNPQSDAVLIAADGGLKNVFVYVKQGLDPAYSFEMPASPVVLDQKGCIYTPRVVGVRAGQPFEVLNSDDTLHNIHALPMANQDFNTSLKKISRTFTVPEVMVRFKCDVHPWMAAYVGVVAHPFFAVTDASGAFELKGVPPGTYTLEAWHERFGTRTLGVTIDPKGSQTATFSFAASPGKQP
jgi:plastocyanin